VHPQPVIETPRPQPRPWLWIGTVALALVAGGGAFLVANRGSDSPGQAAAVPAGASSALAPAAVQTPALDSISLEPREASRECGANSCTVRFDVVAHVEGPGGNDPRLTWKVTYHVLGADKVTVGSFLMGKGRSEALPSETVTVEPGGRIALTVASIDLVPE
jgi:hypothetical protein